MKKLLSLLMILMVLFTTGCEKVSTLLEPNEEAEEVQAAVPTQRPQIVPEEGETVTKIACSQELKMTNDSSILGSNH